MSLDANRGRSLHGPADFGPAHPDPGVPPTPQGFHVRRTSQNIHDVPRQSGSHRESHQRHTERPCDSCRRGFRVRCSMFRPSSEDGDLTMVDSQGCVHRLCTITTHGFPGRRPGHGWAIRGARLVLPQEIARGIRKGNGGDRVNQSSSCPDSRSCLIFRHLSLIAGMSFRMVFYCLTQIVVVVLVRGTIAHPCYFGPWHVPVPL